MTLYEGKKGETYTAEYIDLEENEKRRLEILGLTHNAEVKILNARKNGSMIITVRGTRFAIGKKFAQGIKIKGDKND